MDITSLQNPRVKQIVKLRDDKKQRQRDGLMLVEGYDEISLALSAGHVPTTRLTAPQLARREISRVSAEVITVSPEVFGKISYRENPDGWLGIFPVPRLSLEDLKLGDPPLVVVAESVEKPGNLGAMLRTADALGVDAVLVADPTTDIHNPNVVRASQGALFTVPIGVAPTNEVVTWLGRTGITLVATTPSAAKSLWDADLSGSVAVAVGTESTGLSTVILGAATDEITIPTAGNVDSLNASVTAAIVLCEAARQRRHP